METAKDLRAERAALRQQRLHRLGRTRPPLVAFAAVHARPCVPEPALAPSHVPLSAIGFGPAMVIRFRQIGIETASELAGYDPASLRTALGDITRLIDVDDWIATARKAIAEAE